MRACLLAVSAFLVVPVCSAHVGSPDVFMQGSAGPYQFLVTVRTPPMIPGIAEVEVRTMSPDVRQLRIVPLRLFGPGSASAPPPDLMVRSRQDPQLFSGQVWLMSSGSWQVRVEADGTRGRGDLAVPVPAFARRTLRMQKALGALLLALLLLLAVGAVSIMGAAAREGELEPSVTPTPANYRRARQVMGGTVVVTVAVLYLGNLWWNTEASARANLMIYKAPPVTASVDPPGRLVLRLGASRWHDIRRDMALSKLIPDHGHLMHLFLVRVPHMDQFCHLHPDQTESGIFAQDLPALPAGHYQLFADIVRESGFPDTLTAEIDLADVSGGPLASDDSEATAPPLSATNNSLTASLLSDGSRMIWGRDASPVVARRPTWFRFRVEDKTGQPATDLEPYMGMAGHMVVLRSDRSVFAHVHPAGSVPMAALVLAQKNLTANDEAAHDKHTTANALSSVVSFPYGFPQEGDYRLFVQVKRSGRVETGVFDAHVSPASVSARTL